MIYIDTATTDPYVNFGAEYYYAAVSHLTEPVFLFWQTSPTLMIGKYQNPLEEINLPYAASNGIQIVRRMSGGGTIYTDEGGWQYSFIEPSASEEITFDRYLTPVIGALRALGLDVSFNGRNDLILDGRKISGNAQYKIAGYTVHHGSLLLDTDPEVIAAATHADAIKLQSKSIKSVRERVTTISSHLTETLDASSFRDYMVKAILGEGSVHIPTARERAAYEQIAMEKFRGYDAIYGRTPRFSLTVSRRFTGGKVTWDLEVRHGIVEKASLSGDFFATEEAEKIPRVIEGCRYAFDDILKALRENCSEEALYGVTLSDLASLATEPERKESQT